MPTTAPDYYHQFHCLAGACPHTCCAKWDVVIDPAAAARYRRTPGTLGDELRRRLTERSGEACFALEGGCCPFLNGAGLCRIHATLGEAATSRTCQSHPRFVEEYGPLREITLSASCPEANRLLLASDAPLGFVTLPGDGEGAAPALLEPLLALRGGMLRLLENRALPLTSRLGWLLLLANEAQAALDEDDGEALYDLGTAAETLPPQVPVTPAGPGLFPEAWDVLAGLEVLGDDWLPLLAAARERETPPSPALAAPLERIAAYILFRYLPEAVEDGDALFGAELAVFAVLTTAALAPCLPGAERPRLGEALRRFSREVEHSRENLNALQAAFFHDERLSLARLFAALRAWGPAL